MTKEEFVARVNLIRQERKQPEMPWDGINDDDYKAVDFVYMYHPAIRDKNDIATIYCLNHGMKIIRDMVPTAQKAQARESACRELMIERDKLILEHLRIRGKISRLNHQIQHFFDD